MSKEIVDYQLNILKEENIKKIKFQTLTDNCNKINLTIFNELRINQLNSCFQFRVFNENQLNIFYE